MVVIVVPVILTRPLLLLFGYCPPLSNSWIIIIVWLYIALNRILNIDCYWVGAVPKLLLVFCSVLR